MVQTTGGDEVAGYEDVVGTSSTDHRAPTLSRAAAGQWCGMVWRERPRSICEENSACVRAAL